MAPKKTGPEEQAGGVKFHKSGQVSRKARRQKAAAASSTNAPTPNGTRRLAGRPSPQEEMRGKCVGLLMRAFARASGKAEFARSQSIEAAIFEDAGKDTRDYRKRMRALVFNLGNSDSSLHQRVAGGELTTQELLGLSTEELAPDKLKAAREEERQKYFQTEVKNVFAPPKRRKRDHLYSSRIAERLADGRDDEEENPGTQPEEAKSDLSDASDGNGPEDDLVDCTQPALAMPSFPSVAAPSATRSTLVGRMAAFQAEPGRENAESTLAPAVAHGSAGIPPSIQAELGRVNAQSTLAPVARGSVGIPPSSQAESGKQSSKPASVHASDDRTSLRTPPSKIKTPPPPPNKTKTPPPPPPPPASRVSDRRASEATTKAQRHAQGQPKLSQKKTEPPAKTQDKFWSMEDSPKKASAQASRLTKSREQMARHQKNQRRRPEPNSHNAWYGRRRQDQSEATSSHDSSLYRPHHQSHQAEPADDVCSECKGARRPGPIQCPACGGTGKKKPPTCIWHSGCEQPCVNGGFFCAEHLAPSNPARHQPVKRDAKEEQDWCAEHTASSNPARHQPVKSEVTREDWRTEHIAPSNPARHQPVKSEATEQDWRTEHTATSNPARHQPVKREASEEQDWQAKLHSEKWAGQGSSMVDPDAGVAPTPSPKPASRGRQRLSEDSGSESDSFLRLGMTPPAREGRVPPLALPDVAVAAEAAPAMAILDVPASAADAPKLQPVAPLEVETPALTVATPEAVPLALVAVSPAASSPAPVSASFMRSNSLFRSLRRTKSMEVVDVEAFVAREEAAANDALAIVPFHLPDGHPSDEMDDETLARILQEETSSSSSSSSSGSPPQSPRGSDVRGYEGTSASASGSAAASASASASAPAAASSSASASAPAAASASSSAPAAASSSASASAPARQIKAEPLQGAASASAPARQIKAEPLRGAVVVAQPVKLEDNEEDRKHDAALAHLISMDFEPDKALSALRQTGGKLEAAIDLMFTRCEEAG